MTPDLTRTFKADLTRIHPSSWIAVGCDTDPNIIHTKSVSDLRVADARLEVAG